MLRPGTTVGSYEVIERIGSGGMAVVYRARHTVLGKDVALKELASNLASSERVQTRFRQEAYVQSQLEHANIVRVTDFVIDGDTFAMVMDLVNGPSLEEVLASERTEPWSLDDTMTVMRPVLGAVAFAHARAVVHRDIKPGNVLLERGFGTDGLGVPKVADFGLAKILGSEAGMTRTGAKMGSVPYMSPEQFEGTTEIDARTDVFALGMMFWHLLSGRLPVEPEDMRAVYALYVGSSAVPLLKDLAPDVPDPVATLVMSALSSDPANRPSDAGELAKLMEQTFSLQAEVSSVLPKSAHHPVSGSEQLHRPAIGKARPPVSRVPTSSRDLGAVDRPTVRNRVVVIAVGVIIGVIALIAYLVAVTRARQDPRSNNDPVAHQTSSSATSEHGVMPEPSGREVPVPVQRASLAIGDHCSASVECRAGFCSDGTCQVGYSPDLWRVGNRWVFHVTRRAAPGVTDEAASLDYYFAHQVLSTTETPDGIQVTMSRNGGIEEEITFTRLIQGPCQHSPDGAVICLPSETGQWRVSTILNEEVTNVTVPEADGVFTTYSPELGWLGSTKTRSRGRIEETTLVGAKVGEIRIGDADRLVWHCDWQGRAERSQLYRGAAHQSRMDQSIHWAIQRSQRFNQGRNAPAFREWSATFPTGNSVRFVTMSDSRYCYEGWISAPWSGSREFLNRGARCDLDSLRVWQASDGTEWTVLSTSSNPHWSSGRVLILGATLASSTELDVPPGFDRVRPVLLADGDGCFLQVRAENAAETRVANFRLDPSGPTRLAGGSLNLTVDWCTTRADCPSGRGYYCDEQQAQCQVGD